MGGRCPAAAPAPRCRPTAGCRGAPPAHVGLGGQRRVASPANPPAPPQIPRATSQQSRGAPRSGHCSRWRPLR
eukprot:scaffold72114_cov58-Phaeocystis_antarctica.AAC.3